MEQPTPSVLPNAAPLSPPAAAPDVHARRTAALYALAGTLWIIASDLLLMVWFKEPFSAHALDVVKGVLFVLATSALLYRLLRSALRNLDATRRALEDRSAQHRVATEAGGVGTWSVDLATGAVEADPVLLRWRFDDDRRSPDTQVWIDTIHPDDRPAALAAWADVAAGRSGRFDLDHRIIRPDGEVRWHRAAAKVFRNQRGEPIKVLGTTTDMTDLRLAESALRREQRLFAGGPVVAFRWVAAEGWPVEQASSNVASIFGHKADDFTSGRVPYASVVHPEDLERVAAEVRQHTESRNDRFTQDYRIIDSLGRTRWLSDHTVIVRDAQGRATHYEGYVLDSTARAEAADALARSEARYRRIVETANDGVWVADEHWRTSFVNRRAAQMLGYQPDEMLARPITDFMDEQARAAVQAKIHDRTLGRSEVHEFRFKHRSGADVWAMVSTAPMTDDQGRFTGALAMLTDITAQRRAADLVASQNRVLELLAKGEPLPAVLTALISEIERLQPATIGSILMLEGDRLHTGAAPSLPAEYSAAIDGIVIGPEVGTCGVAAFTRQRVVTTDIPRDPRWQPARDLAAVHALASCWSQPILNADGECLGTFALYARAPRSPSTDEIALVESAAALAGIAIQRDRAERDRRESEQRLRQIADVSDDVFWLADAVNRRVLYVSPAFERIWGRSADDLLADPDLWLRSIHPDDRSRVADASRGEHVRAFDHEYRILRPDGQVRHIRDTGKPVRDPSGGVVRFAGVAADITVMKVAQQALYDAVQRRDLFVRTAPVGIIVWNQDARVIEWNPAAERIFGYAADQAVGMHMSAIVPDSARSLVDRVWADLWAQRGGSRSTNENLHKSGRRIFCEWYNTPLVDQQGRTIAAASLVEDVTQKRTDERRQHLMMAELDHRVKNNLASVISLAEQTGRNSLTFPQFMESFLGRLRAMARMHNALAKSRWQSADLAGIVRQTLEQHAAGAPGRLRADGPEILLNAKAAQALAMALNELSTNAAKYGSLAAHSGAVDVRWSIAGPPDTLILTWQESGGPPISTPPRRGFGSTLIEGLITHELRGRVTLAFHPTGLHCTVETPVEMIVPGITEASLSETDPQLLLSS